MEFHNARYEYTTREMPYSPEAYTLSSDSDRDMAREGWKRVWADITMEGVFAVYRRERKA